MQSWITAKNDGVLLKLKLVPRASRNEAAGISGDALKIRLQAPPVEGKANKALVEFLCERLACPRSAVSIVGGEKSRHKLIHVAGITADRAATLVS